MRNRSTICIFLASVFWASASYAADVPVPNPPPGAVNANPNYLEYKKTGNTYTWNPVGTSTPPGSGSVSFPATQTVSTVEPKFTATGDLPYQHKGGAGAKVSISTGINKQALAKAAASVTAAAAAGQIKPGNPYVTVAQVSAAALSPFIIDALVHWGVNQFLVGADGSVSAVMPDPDASIQTSDGYQYRVSTYPWAPSKAAACQAAASGSGWGSPSVTQTDPNCSFTGYRCDIGQCSWKNTFGPVSYGRQSNSSCPSGSPIVNGVCNGQNPTIERPLERVFQDNIVNKPWEPMFANIAAQAIASGIYKIGENIYTDGTSLDITGPNAVPIGQTTSTWPVNVLPGTTTPAPSGHTGPTEPGTVTQTSTTTAQNTFNPGSSGSSGSGSSSGPGASMTTSQKTETKTSITNNITNVTNIVNNEVKETDDTPEDAPTDTPFADLPELYKQKYPDGLIGVLRTQFTAMKATPLFQLPTQLMGDLPETGQCPSWQVDLNLTTWANFGTRTIGADCAIWEFASWVIVISAFILARALVFGG